MVDEKTIIERDKERPIDCRMGERSLILLQEFKDTNYDKKYILDTTNMSIEETVQEIITNNRFLI